MRDNSGMWNGRLKKSAVNLARLTVLFLSPPSTILLATV
jgi:hypothetical protein